MSNLKTVPMNGSLSNKNSNTNFPTWNNWLDDVFNKELPSVFTSNFNGGVSIPKVNIKETADSYFVDMAVPGLKKSDFQIDLDNQVLSISNKDAEETEDKDIQFTRREFHYSSFKRTFTLPETIDEDKIKAVYNNGILSIQLPKKEEAKQKPARTIQIS
ncbi:Hsp20/alpha crystallin family protein [Polaribacter sp.]|uniref:Hsp20/alpha crystallin family protein n=1 Tax=Polaribacter sp. TaxID=1920175 RepID=UPI003F6C81C4